MVDLRTFEKTEEVYSYFCRLAGASHRIYPMDFRPYKRKQLAGTCCWKAQTSLLYMHVSLKTYKRLMFILKAQNIIDYYEEHKSTFTPQNIQENQYALAKLEDRARKYRMLFPTAPLPMTRATLEKLKDTHHKIYPLLEFTFPFLNSTSLEL